MVLAGNKAKRLSSINNATKTIRHNHLHYHAIDYVSNINIYNYIFYPKTISQNLCIPPSTEYLIIVKQGNVCYKYKCHLV